MALHSLNIILSVIVFAFPCVSGESGAPYKELMTTFKPYIPSDDVNGTRWAVLVAGSSGYDNYRHQADVCHAYQLLKGGGLKDENIVVFMYDDIAYNDENPYPGVIINRPDGKNVYPGVPKDYTGENATVHNLFAVMLGDSSRIAGGSGKIVSSGPNDHIFIYYADHGAPGVLLMPNDEYILADEFIDVLKKKHASHSYTSMIIYVEACESGSMFDSLLSKDWNIYVTTASNPHESSYAFYCPGDDPSPPQAYKTCLGDLFSVSWLEDSDSSNLELETLEDQYKVVKMRTGFSTSEGSHVMQYGDIKLQNNTLFAYMGNKLNNGSDTFIDHKSAAVSSTLQAVDQRDAVILHLNQKLKVAAEGSENWRIAEKALFEEMAHRNHVDRSVEIIGEILFGVKGCAKVLKAVRPAGHPLVDDWNCLRTLVSIYKQYCGSLSRYGMKYMRAFANMCNAGVHEDQVALAAAKACTHL